MGYFSMGYGWTLPPGVTHQIIDKNFGAETSQGCPNPSRYCKCDDCQNTMADLIDREDY